MIVLSVHTSAEHTNERKKLMRKLSSELMSVEDGDVTAREINYGIDESGLYYD